LAERLAPATSQLPALRMTVVWLDERAREVIRTEAKKRRFLETGGALFGYEGDDGDVVVARAFGPGRRAKHRRRSFAPDRQETARLIRRVWQDSERRYRFLGSWHTHPHGRAVPSGVDTETARDLASQDDLRLPEPVVVIQATRGVRHVELGELRAWRLHRGTEWLGHATFELVRLEEVH
jgi:integrative and conjugative element protein (TIGR02256 family)